MAKKFVFGETKVAETSEAIRENKADHKVDNTLAAIPTVSDAPHVPSKLTLGGVGIVQKLREQQTNPGKKQLLPILLLWQKAKSLKTALW